YRTIGITSAQQGEGKTTVAINLAHAMADAGKSVLLVDADLRNRTLTGLLAPASKQGLRDAVKGTVDLGALPQCTQFGFWLLPESSNDELISPPSILSSAAMRQMLAAARRHYDYIVLDLPSTIDHIDVGAIAGLLDGFLLVTEWGRTTIDDVEQALM